MILTSIFSIYVFRVLLIAMITLILIWVYARDEEIKEISSFYTILIASILILVHIFKE